MRLRLIAALALTVAAGPALAVMDEDETPPVPTETTTTCTDGQIWDAETKACVSADSASLDDDTRYRAAREFAYARQFGAARATLDAMAEGDSDRVLTYRGFLARKSGDMDAARRYYTAALEANPGNLLARAYMGMGLAQAGDIAGAERQLAEIRVRGGTGGWPERALAQTLAGDGGAGY